MYWHKLNVGDVASKCRSLSIVNKKSMSFLIANDTDIAFVDDDVI